MKSSIAVRYGNRNVNVDIPTHYWPACYLDPNGVRTYQCISLVHSNSLLIGVVLEVYRGANTKLTKEEEKVEGRANAPQKDIRLMKVAKAVTFELKATMVSRLKVVILTPHEDLEDCWTASSLSKGVLFDPMDPDEGAKGSYLVSEVISQYPRLVIKLPADVKEKLDILKDRCAICATQLVDDGGCCWLMLNVVGACAGLCYQRFIVFETVS